MGSDSLELSMTTTSKSGYWVKASTLSMHRCRSRPSRVGTTMLTRGAGSGSAQATRL